MQRQHSFLPLTFVLRLGVLLALFLTTDLFAKEGYGVDVQLLSPTVRVASPGKSASFIFQVTNTSDKDLDFVSRVRMPSDLNAPYPDPLHYNLLSSMSSTQQVEIYIPKGTSRGRYTLEYLVESMDNPIYNSRQSFIIDVK